MTYQFQARARDHLDQLGEWSALGCTTVDTVAPTVQIGLSPQSGLVIHVTWLGDDGDGSGIDYYDVQYQNEGVWTDWLTGTSQTDAPYTDEDGLTYSFRVKATDQAGNESTWSLEATTTVYSVTKYYAFGAQRVAMRQCNSSDCADAMYLHGDHMGKVSLVMDSTGWWAASPRSLRTPAS